MSTPTTTKSKPAKTKPAKTVSNVRVGKPDVKPTTPTHVGGVHRGNAPGNANGESLGARRSTGINPDGVAPIDPRMPKLSPA
ncbi:MAG TPA: hypothetical protein VGG02_06600 [Chthoniobacterales bacterium]